MYNQDITLNPQAFTGANVGVVMSLQSGPTTTGPTTTSIRAAAAYANTTPLSLDVQHTEIKKNGAKYVRSTVGLRLEGLPPPVGNPEGVVSYANTARIIIERPKIAGVLTDIAIVTHLSQLLSFFGVTLATSGTPSSAMQKLLNKEP